MRVACLLSPALGFGCAAWAATQSLPLDGHLLGLTILLGSPVLLSDRLGIELRVGGHDLTITPEVMAWVVLATFVPPHYAILGGLLTAHRLRNTRASVVLADTGTTMSFLGLASLAAHQLPVTDPQFTVIAALLAAAIFHVASIADGTLYLESQRRGAGFEHLKDLHWGESAFEVLAPAVAAVIVAPFIGNPILALAALVAFQLATFRGLEVLRSEQTHKDKSAFLKDTFARYVPASMVEQLVDAGADVELGGKEVPLTVLFCDIRGFTAWSETLPAGQVIAELNELLGDLAAAVDETGGTLDKFTGDGLMAFWGAPLSQPDHGERACITAFAMLDALKRRNAGRHERGQPALEIGIGIHSGSAVVGNVGRAERHDYTAIGDTVNTAARLEAATKEIGCIAAISQGTHQLVQGIVGDHCTRYGDVTVKGRSENVETYVLIASANDSFARHSGGTHAPRPTAGATPADLTELLREAPDIVRTHLRNEHSRTVAMYSQDIALALGLTEATAQRVRLAAALRDLGTQALPPDLLDKPGQLEEDELALIQQVPEISELILREAGGYDDLCDAVRHHRERMDGSGYPDNLAADDIPLWSRIISVAEAYAAMLQPRPYRPAMTPVTATYVMRHHEGHQHDPAIVSAFQQVLNARDESYARGALGSGDRSGAVHATNDPTAPWRRAA